MAHGDVRARPSSARRLRSQSQEGGALANFLDALSDRFLGKPELLMDLFQVMMLSGRHEGVTCRGLRASQRAWRGATPRAPARLVPGDRQRHLPAHDRVRDDVHGAPAQYRAQVQRVRRSRIARVASLFSRVVARGTTRRSFVSPPSPKLALSFSNKSARLFRTPS